jgi:hypothetical protein
MLSGKNQMLSGKIQMVSGRISTTGVSEKESTTRT